MNDAHRKAAAFEWIARQRGEIALYYVPATGAWLLETALVFCPRGKDELLELIEEAMRWCREEGE